MVDGDGLGNEDQVLRILEVQSPQFKESVVERVQSLGRMVQGAGGSQNK